MATYYARKANKVLKISEEAIEKYLGQGYTITDQQGSVLKKGTPLDSATLTAEYKKQLAEIDNLKATIASVTSANKALITENADLKAENADLKAQVTTLSEMNDNLTKKLEVLTEEKPVEEKPATTRKRRAKADTEETE